jgi:hypothetical protein
MEVNIVNGCRSHAVNFPFTVEPLLFEAALVNAVQHTGHRLRFRNIRPVADNSTATGWA